MEVKISNDMSSEGTHQIYSPQNHAFSFCEDQWEEKNRWILKIFKSDLKEE